MPLPDRYVHADLGGRRELPPAVVALYAGAALCVAGYLFLLGLTIGLVQSGGPC